jgi:hypothetical protein
MNGATKILRTSGVRLTPREAKAAEGHAASRSAAPWDAGPPHQTYRRGRDPIRRSRSPSCRSADPVETATWSRAGQLDWWVRERREWWGRVRGADGLSGGSELLIFVPRTVHSCDLSWSFVGGDRAISADLDVARPPDGVVRKASSATLSRSLRPPRPRSRLRG